MSEDWYCERSQISEMAEAMSSVLPGYMSHIRVALVFPMVGVNQRARACHIITSEQRSSVDL